MNNPQPKFLTKLGRQKAFANAERDSLAAKQKVINAAHDAEREELASLAKDSTDKNRQFFVLYLGLLVYVLLMVFGTTDQMLLVPTQGIKLPLIDVTLPLLAFYVVAPLFLLTIHFNLLQNLESHHYKLMRWRDACGGEVPRKEISAFLFDYEWLEKGSKMEWMVGVCSQALFLHSGPFALGILLWRFTDYQNIWITSWHLLAFIVDSYLVWLTDKAFLKNKEPDQLSFSPTAGIGCFARMRMVVALFLRLLSYMADSVLTYSRMKVNAALLLLLLHQLLHLVSYMSGFILCLMKIFLRRKFGVLILLQFCLACWFYFSSEGFVDGWKSIDGRSRNMNFEIYKYVESTFWLHSLFVPIISIDKNEIVWIPDKNDIETQAMLAGGTDILQRWQQHGLGLNLTGRHLRGAYLYFAQLQGAILDGAQLQGASLLETQLQGTRMLYAQLQGAMLRGAQLQGAEFMNAQLQGADLSGAQLQGADLRGAQLQGASLEIAGLQGADLRYAKLQGAFLNHSRLQCAALKGTQLQGAIFSSVGFSAPELPGGVTQVAYANTMPINHFNDTDKIEPNCYVMDGHEIPNNDLQREFYEERIRNTWERNNLTFTDFQKNFPDQPEVVWLNVIPSWDNDIKFESKYLLIAARQLKMNYSMFTNENACKAPPLSEDDTNFGRFICHPEYVAEINKAFCASKRMKELCDPQLAAEYAKGASVVPASVSAKH